jgi:hypothetical protein
VKTVIRQRHTSVVAFAILLVLGILLNACGDSNQSSGQITTTTPTSSAQGKPTQAGPVSTTTEFVPTPTTAACGTQLSGVNYLSVDATAQASAGGGGTQTLLKGDLYGVIVPASDATHPVTIQINYSTRSESCSFYSTRRVAVIFTSPEDNVSLEVGGNNLVAEQITQPCSYLTQNNLTQNDLVFFGDKETGRNKFSC